MIDLSAESLSITGPYRVGIQFQHAATPSVAVDDDGPTAARNFVDLGGGGWQESPASGDFVVRSTVNLPEPAQLWMLAAGVGFLVTVGRRRMRL